MEGEATADKLLSPLYIFFLIGAVVASYLLGRYQNISQMITPETKVEGVATSIDQFQIVDAKAEVSPNEKSGCIYNIFHLTGSVTANSKGTATYKWEGSDNSTLAPIVVNFDNAGTKTIETDWQAFGPGQKWVKLHILSPNDISSPEVGFKLICS